MRARVSALTLLLVSVCLAGTFWGHGWCGGAKNGALNLCGSFVGLSVGLAVKFRTILLGCVLCGGSVLALGFEAQKMFPVTLSI